MSACHLEDEEQYLARLQLSSQEMEALVEAVVIPETSFFRDKSPFAALSQHVREEWIPAGRTTPIRILSVPCASGEEPYSIAMTLLEAGLRPGQYAITALDISRSLLRKAERAAYTQYSFRGVSESLRARYFDSVGHEFVLKDRVREGVRFAQGNLMDSRVLTGRRPYDVVFCRNLMIYLEAGARASVMNTLERLVAQNGLLFVGHAEMSCFSTTSFLPLDPRSAFHFRKVDDELAGGRNDGVVALSLKIPVLPFVEATPQRSTPEPKTATAPSEVPQARSSIEIARQLADRGQLSEAAAVCEQWLQENGADAGAYCLLGVVLHGLEDFQRAEECLDRALYLDERCYDAVVHLALIRERRGDAAGAEVLRRRAERIQRISEMP